MPTTLTMATIRPGTKCEVREQGSRRRPDNSTFLGFSLCRPSFYTDPPRSIAELVDAERTLRAWRKHHNLNATEAIQYAWFETEESSPNQGSYTWAAYYWRGRWRLGTSADTFTLVRA